MVIEKILKVPAGDQSKVDDLKKRLQALQAQTKNEPKGPLVPTPPRPAAPTTPAPPAKAVVPAQTSQKDDIARLQELSEKEQHDLAVRQNPELRIKEERTLNLVMNQVKELIVLMADANKRLKDFEVKHNDLKKDVDAFKTKHEEVMEKMNTIDSRLEKFMGLYELVTNQYNPFADDKVVLPQQESKPLPKEQKQIARPQAVQIEDSISKTAGTVQLSPDDVAKSDEQFRRVEQLLADLHKQAEQKNGQQVPANTQESPLLVNELHTLLAGFESRLTRQLDASVQGKLHEGLARLESSLQQELRDALRLEIEKAKAEDAAVDAELRELEALIGEGMPKDKDAAAKEFEALTSEVEALKQASRGPDF